MSDTTTQPQISDFLTNQELLDLFITAYEGGSNYWCGQEIPSTLREKYKSETAQSPSEYVFAAVLGGEEVVFFDQEEPEDTWTLTLDQIKKGTEKMVKEYRDHYADVLNESYDATTADVWFQLCLLDDITFG